MLYPVVREDAYIVVDIVFADLIDQVPEHYQYVEHKEYGELYVDTSYEV